MVWNITELPTIGQRSMFSLVQMWYIHARALEKHCLGSCSRKLPKEVSGLQQKEGAVVSPDAWGLKKEL